ncbi:MAG: copper resistance CopC family protein [Stellaceae bacterium]
MRARNLAIAMLVAGLAIASSPRLRAHAYLDRAVPAVGETVAKAPPQTEIWFSEKLEAAFSTIEVFDANGKRVDRGDTRIDPQDGRLLRVSLQPLPPGTYKVQWRAVSVDTHATEGNFTFTVGK